VLAQPAFVDEFPDIIERTVTYAVPTVILDDINVYLDDPDAPRTAGVDTTLAGFDLVQLVTGPTHNRGHTLDIV